MDVWHTGSCLECGSNVGDPHWPGCGQATRRATRAPAPGYEPGQAEAIRECRCRGWAVAHVDGEGFRPCEPGEPGSYVDLDRFAYWLEHGDAVLHGNEPVV
jgi:hypothetical protein